MSIAVFKISAVVAFICRYDIFPRNVPNSYEYISAYNYLKNLETKNVETQDGASRLEEKHQQKRMKQKVVEIRYYFTQFHLKKII